MITAIREARRARGLTLDDVARRCVPPTTPQTVGRLETGTRTVSVVWLNRIAAAIGVEAAALVRLPDRVELPVAATLDAGGAHAPRREAVLAAPAPAPGMLALTVTVGVGEYRAGDHIWLEPLGPEAFPTALNRDVLVPRAAGRFVFGRLLGVSGEAVQVLPLGAGAGVEVVADPAWIARAVRLVRGL